MKSLKIQKEVIRSCESKENRQNNGQNKQSEAVNRMRTHKTMANRKHGKTMIYKILHRKLKIEQHEPH